MSRDQTVNRNAAQNVSEDQVYITRTFSAPRELVYEALTQKEHLLQWHAPNNCTIQYEEFEARPGGSFLSCIHTPNGHQCWCKGTFHELEPPKRLVYSMSVADELGRDRDPVSAGMDPSWPKETIVTITLEECDGRTILTLHQTVSFELAKRTGAYPSWLQMFDRLAMMLQKSAYSLAVSH